MVARGEFGRWGVATQNGRIYSESLMGREIKRLNEDLKSRRVLGELDHPSDGKTSLKRVSHVVFPENMGPIAISKYPDIVILLIVVVLLCCS